MSDEMLIRCCAPTMACLKTGSMFNCAFESGKQMTDELRSLNQRLRWNGLRILPLRRQGERVLLYMYRPELLKRDLNHPLARRLLSECGYTCFEVGGCLAQLRTRLKTNDEFPHEVGLFLGYPPADVDGFMHRRDSYKLCGLWKVYDDVESASRQFDRCRRCTKAYLCRYAQGWPLEKLTVLQREVPEHDDRSISGCIKSL